MILKMHFLFEELKENVHKYSYCICDGDNFKSDLCYGSFMLCVVSCSILGDWISHPKKKQEKISCD